MNSLDRITSLELKWRDTFFWPLARPLGILYEYLWRYGVSRVLFFVELCTPSAKEKRAAFLSRAHFLQKEILTLANLVTLYGIFLLVEFLRLAWAWFFSPQELPVTYSITNFVVPSGTPALRHISWLITEILVTDLTDGPLARNNHAVSALGTLLDHARDYLLGFFALVFLIVVTMSFGDWIFLALEILSLIGFGIIWHYHMKMILLRKRAWRFPQNTTPRQWVYARAKFLAVFALHEYQSPLAGRIQFGALASVIGAGLFYYATDSRFFFTSVFIASAISTGVTAYYILVLMREYGEKLRVLMQKESERLKSRAHSATHKIRSLKEQARIRMEKPRPIQNNVGSEL